MLREEQIDIRRKRAAAEQFRIRNLGRNRVFSDYQVTNPATGGQYQVSIRGFDVGDNSCTCPDFRTNTLGTCKHVEAVLAALSQDAPATVRQRKATVMQPEVFLSYGEQLRLGLHLPPRHSDQLQALAARFFDCKGLWKDGDNYTALVDAINGVPEQVTIFSDAMDFIDRENERREMAGREQALLRDLDEGRLDLGLLKVPLYPYQTRGALFLAYRGRSILGDDMGLGKTPQTLAATELLARERGVERVMVVAPASVKYQWEGEIRKFTDRPVQVIDGPTKARRSLYGQPTFYRLVNYEVALRDLEALNAWQPDLIVLDEAQRIKNWESKISRAVKKLRSRYAIVLTGTPLENKLEELYSIVQFVDDRRLGPAFQFLHDHRVIDATGKLVGYRNLDRIRERLQPILLRRTRQEVISQLPARTDSTIFVELTDSQKAPYAEQQTTLARLLAKKYLTEIDRRRILCCLTNMRMLCDSTFLLDKTSNVSPKLEEFAELMGELVTEGSHKVVVFSQWELMLRKAAEVLDRQGIGYATLHGGVPGRERKALLDRFREDGHCKVFLSTDAGGTGLNLQAADTVVNLEVPWNPAVLEQRIARVHRLGQHRPVRAINLVTRGTIEERVLKTLELKRSLFEGVFAGTADEVSFEALGQRAFLDTVRTLIGEEAPVPQARSDREAPPAPDGREALARAGVQFLEALANLCSAAAQAGQTTLQLPLPPAQVLHSSAAAIRALIGQLGRDAHGSADGPVQGAGV
jgi:superfamily II DNA or RNA helicase